MKSTTSIFKIHQSSWGIWIKITGNSKLKEERGENLLVISPEKIKLSQQEEKYLKDGFTWASSAIDDVTEKKYEIAITSIELVHTDYQEEGLFYAIAFWLSEHFDFDLPKFEYSFNKELNRYEFSELMK